MQKKTPTRTCIACGAKEGKTSLVRIVRSPEGEVSLDLKGRAPGRGAYICRAEKCFALARKKRLFSARLKVQVTEECCNRLEEEFLNLCRESSPEAQGRDGE